MTRPIPFFQLNPTNFCKHDAVPRDDQHETLLLIGQHDPFELTPLPSPSCLYDLDSVRSPAVGRRFENGTRSGKGGRQVACGGVHSVRAQVAVRGDVFAPCRGEDERGGWRGTDGVSTVVVRIGASESVQQVLAKGR